LRSVLNSSKSNQVSSIWRVFLTWAFLCNRALQLQASRSFCDKGKICHQYHKLLGATWVKLSSQSDCSDILWLWEQSFELSWPISWPVYFRTPNSEEPLVLTEYILSPHCYMYRMEFFVCFIDHMMISWESHACYT
jgi:hypothetical protein